MLSLDQPQELHGVLLYRDHSHPHRYYFMPAAPRIARSPSGSPLMALTVYRRDVTDNPAFSEGDSLGGGFLDLTVDLGVPRSRIERVRDELGRRYGVEVELGSLPVEDGSVRISVLSTSETDSGAEPGRFVETILGATKPSLYDDNRATFSVQLSQEGALLLEAEIRNGGATQIGVVYELRFRGMLPAYRANVSIDFRQSYDHLRERFQANTLVFKADLDQELETLRRDEVISIEQEDFRGMSPEQQAAESERLEQLARDLATGSLFTPSLRPGQVLAADRGAMEVYDGTVDAAEHDAGFTAPLIDDLLAEVEASGARLVYGDADGGLGGIEVDGGAEDRETSGSDRESGGGAGRHDPTAVERWNQAGRPQAGFLLKRLQQRELRTVRYETKRASAVMRTIAPQGSITLLRTDDPDSIIQYVDLDSAFFDSIRGSVRTTSPLAEHQLDSVVVRLRYGQNEDGSRPKDTAEIVLREAGEGQPYRFMADHTLDVSLEYQVVLHRAAGPILGDGRGTTESPWRRTDGRHLSIHAPSHGRAFFAAVEPGLVDWEDVSLVECAVVYDDANHGGRHTAVLDERSSALRIPIQPFEGGSRQWHVEARLHYADGTTATVVTPPRLGDDLVVLQGPPDRMADLELELRDPLGRYERVVVDLRAETSNGVRSTTISLDHATPRARWRVGRGGDGERPLVRYRTMAFLRNGSVEQGAWTSTPAAVLPVGDVFDAAPLEVEVYLLVPDFREAGLMAANLQLDYDGVPPGIDGSESMTWTAADPTPRRWRVPRRRDGGESFRYRITWVRRDGVPELGAPVETSTETLFIAPPPSLPR